ncbi:DUF523 domain-containing protein [Thermodesulfobacteriota bacterium]
MKKKTLSSLKIDEHESLQSCPIMISGCLLGLACRYDGGECGSSSVIRFASSANVVSFCPEQLGGLPTPRPAANIVGGDGHDVLRGTARVIDIEGHDVTRAFKKGAEESLRLARATRSKIAVTKDRSPSCGLGKGNGPQDPVMGVTVAYLGLSGINVFEISSQDTFPSLHFIEMVRKIYG